MTKQPIEDRILAQESLVDDLQFRLTDARNENPPDQKQIDHWSHQLEEAKIYLSNLKRRVEP